MITWDKMGGNGGTTSIPWSSAAPWLTWANTDIWNSPAIHALGMKTVLYTNPNRAVPGSPLYSNQESDFAHDCNSNRVYATTGIPNLDVMDPHSQNHWQMWQQYVSGAINGSGGVFDAIFEDTADEVQQVDAKPCNFVQSDWSTASNEMIQYLGHPVIFDGLWALDHTGGVLGVSPTIALTQTAIGGMFEGCYVTQGSLPILHNPGWTVIENTELQMAARHSQFICEGLDHTSADTAFAARTWLLASFLLTYDPATSVYDSEFATQTGFHVMPEAQLVPRQPLVAEPSDVSSLLLSTGAYGREYRACYYGGAYVGPCAVVVNPGSGTKNFPWPGKYTHTLTYYGSGVLDGGVAGTNGPPPPATLGPSTAEIVFQ